MLPSVLSPPFFVVQEVQCQEYEPIVCGQSGRERPRHVRYALCLPTSALGFGVQALWMRWGPWLMWPYPGPPSCPVFGYSMENMKGTVAYLEELGVDVTKVVNRCPSVFGYSMENMKGTVAYLEELGVDVTKVVNGRPTVFGYSMENMKGTVAYLEELGVDVTKVVNRCPTVFGLSMENMKGTVAYLSGTCGFMPTRSVFRGWCLCGLICAR